MPFEKNTVLQKNKSLKKTEEKYLIQNKFRWMGAKGDQDMATLGDADWSQDWPMDKGARSARVNMVAAASANRYGDCKHVW